MPYTLSQAVLEDLPELVPLFSNYRNCCGQGSDNDGSRFFLLLRLSQLESVIFASWDEAGKAVGFAQLYPLFSSLTLQRTWILNDLFVEEDHRRQGIGSALVTKAQEFSKACEAEGLQISTLIHNTAAQKLFEKLGFSRDQHYIHYEWRTS